MKALPWDMVLEKTMSKSLLPGRLHYLPPPTALREPWGF